jgi:Tfp pilus assembly protein PilV
MTNSSSSSKRRDSREAGMSMIEMMIAVGILGFGILAGASSQLTAMKFTRESQLRTEAYYLAAQQMERFQSMTANEIGDIKDLGTYPNDVDNNPIDPDPNDGRSRAFNRSWDIQDDVPSAGLYTISVIVSWQDGSGTQRSINVESVKVSS